MKKDFLLAIYDCEEKLMDATKKAMAEKIQIYDIYTPFPVHGLDEVMGIRRSFLPYVTFLAGLGGLILAFSFQIWTSAVDWPTIIGGKPFISWPAFFPISFEITILLAAHTTVFAFLASNKLFPGKKPVIMHDEQTCNKFVIAVSKAEANIDAATELFKNNGAIEVKLQNIDLSLTGDL